MTKQLCKNCKHLGLDGMFGLICEVMGNNKNHDCPKYEENDVIEMTNKRFMVDDAGTLIDMQTRDMFDIVEEVCPLLNEQHETIHRLKQNIDELLSVDVEEDLLKETEELKQQNKGIQDKVWKLLELLEKENGIDKRKIIDWWNGDVE